MNTGIQAFTRGKCFVGLIRFPVQQCASCRLKTTGKPPTFLPSSTSRALSYQTGPRLLRADNGLVHHRFHQPSRHLLRVSDNFASFLGSSKATDWTKAVTEAEKIVGYPTSFMSLRCLLSDEFSNVALHMRKLVGTKHPLLKTARRFVFDGTESLQIRGLLVLLVAKAAGAARTATSVDGVAETMVSGIYPSQRNLAEITEMIYTAQLIHTGVVDVATVCPDTGRPEDVQFGNKLAVLCGDFLLANASTALARLYNTEVVELISSAIRDITAAEFTTPSDTTQFTDSPTGDATISQWERQTFLSTGSLLAKSCKAVLMLARHSEEWQEAGFQFGRSMGFAYQLHEELRSVVSPESEEVSVRMTSLPVAWHLDDRPEDRELVQKLLNSQSDKLRKQLGALLSSSGTIARARGLVKSYQERALQAASVLGENEARTAINNMVQAVTDV